MTNKKDTTSAPEAQDALRVIPLGGLGQVGMNCMVIECGDEAVLIDCGMTFPEVDVLGVDLILPEMTYLLENAEKLLGVILTHGHEDHIGAMPFLLKELDIPVYGTPLTLGLLRHKLREHNLLDQCELVEVGTRKEIELGDLLSFEFIHVNHSIPDACAVALHTPMGAILHTGDWRVDHTPISGPPIDLASFAEFGDEGVLCLLGDSTNVEQSGMAASESEVLRGLEQQIRQAKGRVLVTMFSSNVHRIQGLLEIAHATGRRVLVNGRSLMNMFNIARNLGYIRLPRRDIMLDLGDVGLMPDDEVLIISTGSQGEPRSSMARIAHDDHNQIKVREGDTVIFSARVVPGNETKVNNIINALWSRGVEVITKRDALVHTTGHAYREDLKLMFNLTRPKFFIPVHGEMKMLIKHARLAHEMGIENTCVLTNGEVAQITEESIQKAGRVPSGRIMVDGKGVGDINDVVLRDRLQLARAGMLIAAMVIDIQDGAIVSGPRLLQHGVVEGVDSKVLSEARRYALERIKSMSPDSLKDTAEVAETLRVALRRFFRRRFQRKPVVVPIVSAG